MTEKFYNTRRAKNRDSFFSKHRSHDGSTDLLVRYIVQTAKKLPYGARILDLGTGNGYLAKRVLDEVTENIEVYGIDLSPDMLKTAQNSKYVRLRLCVMDNLALEFEDGYFDLVMAKSVSNISIKEVDRVLKPGGHFFYKEYSGGKGLVDIFDRAQKVREIGGEKITADLYKACFRSVKIEYIMVPVRRTKDQVLETLSTMRIAKDIEDRESLVDATNNIFGSKVDLNIISDPFIIRAQK